MPSVHGMGRLVPISPELPLLRLLSINKYNSLVMPVRSEDARPKPRLLRLKGLRQIAHIDAVADAQRFLHRDDRGGEDADSLRTAQRILREPSDLLPRKRGQAAVSHLFSAPSVLPCNAVLRPVAPA